MSDRPERLKRLRSSRQRYLGFVEDYKLRRLDASVEPSQDGKHLEGQAKADEASPGADPESQRRGKRREYLRAYLRWLWPHRYAFATVFLFAMLVAGLEMIEPLFMRFIIDHVLLDSTLDSTSRLTALNIVGAVFLA